MRMLFRQRVFSWFDSYDIYDENEQPLYSVQGRFAWGHKLEISDGAGRLLGMVWQAPLTFLPRFTLHEGEDAVGEMVKEFTLFSPRYSIDDWGWQVEGDFLGWSYTVTDSGGNVVMEAYKELLHWTDFYVIDVANPADALRCLMVVLAIDAANCQN